jgi:hypothetical protein
MLLSLTIGARMSHPSLPPIHLLFIHHREASLSSDGWSSFPLPSSIVVRGIASTRISYLQVSLICTTNQTREGRGGLLAPSKNRCDGEPLGHRGRSGSSAGAQADESSCAGPAEVETNSPLPGLAMDSLASPGPRMPQISSLILVVMAYKILKNIAGARSMRSRAGRSQFPTDCISHSVLLVGTEERCGGSLEVEDGGDMWAHFVSERMNYLVLWFFYFCL